MKCSAGYPEDSPSLISVKSLGKSVPKRKLVDGVLLLSSTAAGHLPVSDINDLLRRDHRSKLSHPKVDLQPVMGAAPK